MKKAVLKSDPAKRLIPIKEWLVKHHGQTPSCPICNCNLRVDAQLSKTVGTYFSHPQGSGCPTTPTSGAAFRYLQGIPRGTAAEAASVRQYALDNLESIYYRAKEICPELKWTEFLPLLDKARELDAWSLQAFDKLYIPYLLLCCAESFDGIRGSDRPRKIFFVLEPEASKASFWQRTGEKRRIWRVVESTKDVDDIQMILQECEPWYRQRARRALML
ncbi:MULTISPECIES: hypothetical protein [Xanthomonas]|uniref:hypothetical protein n=1 Tax=Xanthomonas TaxID=338 RepID=UPI0011C05D39|nr:hypothetical protein [Xanthomonas campestris]MCC5095362.1 hypothetical protein [Xanthomonas campestris pv. incanae]MEA9613150.1 hypothetical protein [Xanthomonas campestris pv. incanae]WDJ09141.1 hypothetical protein JH299_16275 [Xanthomonas campestris pv. incanae]